MKFNPVHCFQCQQTTELTNPKRKCGGEGRGPRYVFPHNQLRKIRSRSGKKFSGIPLFVMCNILQFMSFTTINFSNNTTWTAVLFKGFAIALLACGTSHYLKSSKLKVQAILSSLIIHYCCFLCFFAYLHFWKWNTHYGSIIFPSFSLPVSVCSHFRSLQPSNQSESNLEGLFPKCL